MDRAIKFRGWDTGINKMWSEIEMGRDELTINPDGRGFVNVNNITRLSQYYTHIIPLQYTGLKDKNGKEIYEGDIVLFPDEEREFVDVGIGVPLQVAAQPVKELGQVTFENGGFGFNCNRKSAYYEKGFSSFTLADFKPELNELEDIEIIGNIYENPELLTNN